MKKQTKAVKKAVPSNKSFGYTRIIQMVNYDNGYYVRDFLTADEVKTFRCNLRSRLAKMRKKDHTLSLSTKFGENGHRFQVSVTREKNDY